MHKLACLMMAAGLAAAVVSSGGGPYEQAARHLEISLANAHDVIKADAHQAVMRDAQDLAPLPAGMKVVLPEPNGGVRVIARGPAVA